MIEYYTVKYYIRRNIQTNLLSYQSVTEFDELKTHVKYMKYVWNKNFAVIYTRQKINLV